MNQYITKNIQGKQFNFNLKKDLNKMMILSRIK